MHWHAWKVAKETEKKILSSIPGERALRALRENSYAIALIRFLNMELPETPVH